jgi:adenylosuccinate lyase
VSVALDLRQGHEQNDLVERLAADPRLGLSADALAGLLTEPLEFTGAARAQVAAFVTQVNAVVARFPHAAAYQPASIL